MSSELVKELRERAESYRMGGPSSEHTAALLDDAAARIEALEAENKRLGEALDDLLSWFPEKPSVPEWRLKAGKYGADDAVDAARRAREGGNADG